jgi:RimJ/RimL family protein N-acetyltransferase
VIPQTLESAAKPPSTASEIRERALKPGNFRSEVDLMILLDGQAVGHASIIFDPPHRLTRDQGKVAWWGICIGEPSARRQGLGRHTILHLESVARDRGARCAEAGAFEFNHVSQHFFRSLGYQPIGRLPRITYWQGRYWDDIRFLKLL